MQYKLILLISLFFNFQNVDVINLNQNEQIHILEKESEVKKENLLCEIGKGLTYTNIDNININWNYIDSNYYINSNGFVVDKETNAIYAAMSSKYEKNAIYSITLTNDISFKIKNVDLKQDIHTTNKCYTTHDNSIVELWITNNEKLGFKSLGNSKVVNVFVKKIEKEKQ